jgi:trimeric autotransporter adhesin
MNRLTQSKTITILPVLIALTLGCFALSPQARAVCQQGCLTNFNTVLGDNALVSNTTGSFNTAIGFAALVRNTTGSSNTASGLQALEQNTSGSDNTATGMLALELNTIGDHNTANGADALSNNTTGSNNTATGHSALRGDLIEKQTGDNNTATGADALYSNTTGAFNTASGYSALYTNMTGGFNVAYGGLTLFSNTTGNSNTAIGYDALYSNQNGMNNTATGVETLVRNTTGSSNTALGYFALNNNSTGNNNIAVGEHAGSNQTTGSNNIDIGNLGVAGESKTIRVGIQGTQNKTFIAGISGATVPGGVGVIVGNNGKLGTVVSSARFKDDINPMDKASEALHSLQPVTFRYKEELDPEGIPQFGLVAEEVEKVSPELVARDEQGKPYTVRYEAVNAMLLNEFLKEHRKVEEQNCKLHEQGATIARLEQQIDALTAGLQKVSAQLEVSKAAPQTVQNNQ